MSGLFRSTTIKGTRITDFAKTSADVGNTIPFLYGRAPVTGNVIFAALPPKENRQVKRQGKGGVKQETFTYTTSYAISFCRGPIQGYWWIKRNGKVVYSQDPVAPIEDQAYAAKWAAKVMMYNGTSSQMPNSTIESYKGSGRVSAFRYLAYIVVPNEDITEGGGAIPSYEAVPIASPAEIWLTSKPYAQFILEAVTTTARVPFVLIEDLLKEADVQEDKENNQVRLTGGALAESLGTTIADKESNAIVLSGGVLSELTEGVVEDNQQDITTLSGGALVAVPTGYPQDDKEQNSITLSGGALSNAESGPTIDKAALLAKITSWWEMDEEEGTRFDSKGSNHLSTVAGAVSTASGVRGGDDVAASFTGGGGLVAADSTTLDVPSGGGDHCFFGWFYVTSGNCMLMAKWDASSATTMEYGAEVYGSDIYAENGGGTYYYPIGPRPPNGEWHFFVGWRDSMDGKVRQQVDNGTIYVSPSASNPNPTSNGLGFGQAGTSPSSRLNGRLQRWGWIKGAILTADERTWLYNGGAGRTYSDF